MTDWSGCRPVSDDVFAAILAEYEALKRFDAERAEAARLAYRYRYRTAEPPKPKAEDPPHG